MALGLSLGNFKITSKGGGIVARVGSIKNDYEWSKVSFQSDYGDYRVLPDQRANPSEKLFPIDDPSFFFQPLLHLLSAVAKELFLNVAASSS